MRARRRGRGTKKAHKFSNKRSQHRPAIWHPFGWEGAVTAHPRSPVFIIVPFTITCVRGRLPLWSLAFTIACSTNLLSRVSVVCCCGHLTLQSPTKKVYAIKIDPKIVPLCEVTFREGVESPRVCGFSCRSCCCCYCRFFLPLKPRRHLRLSKQPEQTHSSLVHVDEKRLLAGRHFADQVVHPLPARESFGKTKCGHRRDQKA